MTEMGESAGLSGAELQLTANPFDQYRYPLVANRDREWGLFVTGAGRQTVGPGLTRDTHPAPYEYTWATGRTLSNEFGLLCVTAGRAEVLESEAAGALPLAVGNVVLLFPGVWHRYRFDPTAHTTHLWVTFGGDHSQQLLRRGLLSPRRPVLPTVLSNELLEPFARLLKHLRDPSPGQQQRLAAAVLELLGVATVAPPTSAPPDLLEHARRLLGERLSDVIDLEDLADKLGMSYDRFRRRFKERFGIAPYQHRLLCKLTQAQELLATTDLSVARIAEMLRFDDPFHFSRLFKRKFGVAPSACRRITPIE